MKDVIIFIDYYLMNKTTFMSIKRTITVCTFICSFVLLFLFWGKTNNVQASCSCSCGGSCVQCGSVDESHMGCSSGRPGTWCCPLSCVCTCSPGACGGCTPSCPAGQSTTVTGDLCRQGTSSCTGSDGCSACTLTGGYCYLLETNVTPSIPASISMAVDGVIYQLSTNTNTPTQIKLPTTGSSNVQVSVPTFTAPATSRGGGYYFVVNNYGNNNEWQTWTTCSGIAPGEDFCTTVPSTNNTQNFVPASKTVNQVLKEGAKGKISGMYTTLDKCANTYKYSLPIEGYYVVDTLTDVPVACTPGTEGCNILPNVSSSLTNTESTTVKGCNTTTYTGSEANNPLAVSATLTDANSISEIQGYILWLSSDTSVPITTTISSPYTTGDSTDVGIFVRKNGASWSNTPLVYGLNTSDNWLLMTADSDGNRYIKNNSTNIIRIYDISITESTNVSISFKLEFLNTTSNLSGVYNIYSVGLDSYMINNGVVDLTSISKIFDWGIDMVNPTVNTMTQSVHNATQIDISWGISDGASGIDRTVLNGYRVGGTQTTDVNLYLPTLYTTNKGTISLNTIPSNANLIGLYNDSNAWKFIGGSGEVDRLDIGGNESGNIDIYTTTYDKACNSSSGYVSVDLDPWFTTRGGSVYSRDSILSTPKDVSSSSALQGGVLKNFSDSQLSLLDTGTEAISSFNNSLVGIAHSSLGAVEALGIYDSTNVKNIWFDNLKTAFTEMQGSLQRIYDITDICDNSCYMLSEDPNTDITIPKDYTCTRPTLFMSERDIDITPNITNDNSHLSGCVFVARRNINISGGDHLSGSKVAYDYLEGFFIAENQIIVEMSDSSFSVRDGLELKGSMIALGSNVSTGVEAIDIQRNLKLFNQTNPAVVMTYDNRYSSISQLFFGIAVPTYRQDIGFKSF